tara:strand:- start:1179 stop:2090 length:912 start_codon:yes stop_codon:yes gene_type:complete
MAKRSRRRKKAKPPADYRDGEIEKSRPDSKPALIALLLVVILIGSGLYLTSMVDTEESIKNPVNAIYSVEAELVTNNHNTEPGGETDFVLLVRNTGSVTDTFTISTKSNDGGFTIEVENGFETIMLNKDVRKPLLINVRTSASAEGLLSSYIEVVSGGDNTKRAEVQLSVNADHDFGNKTKIGDSLNLHYAGILANNAEMFDSSMEYMWDNYVYLKDGVTSNNRHTSTLASEHIGCNDSGNPSENCDGRNNMIDGFDSRTIGMYEGQTLAVRIPAKDAYGENPDNHDLGGEDLIFIIEVVSII